MGRDKKADGRGVLPGRSGPSAVCPVSVAAIGLSGESSWVPAYFTREGFILTCARKPLYGLVRHDNAVAERFNTALLQEGNDSSD